MKRHPTPDDAYPLDADCELPPRLLQLFVNTAPEQMSGLVAACRSHDAPGARELAHKLKGGLYVVGASRLAEQLEALRSVLERADWATMEGLLPVIETDFRRVVEQLTRRIGDTGT